MKERWLVGYVEAVVDGQYPIVLTKHRYRYHCLTRLALGSEVCVAEKWEKREGGNYDYRPEYETVALVIHLYSQLHLYSCKITVFSI